MTEAVDEVSRGDDAGDARREDVGAGSGLERLVNYSVFYGQ